MWKSNNLLSSLILSVVLFSIFAITPLVFADEPEVEFEDDDGIMTLIDKEHYSSDKIEEFVDLEIVDGLVDLYVNLEKSDREDSTFEVEIQVFDECVKGNTSDEARMKLGFTTIGAVSLRDWLPDEFIVENEFFSSEESSDINKKIDLVDLSTGAVAIPFPSSGDDLIQKNPDDDEGSFEHENKLRKIDQQPGWEGSFSFTGPSGNYIMWLIFPAEGFASEPCDNTAALGIHITIPETDEDHDEDHDEDIDNDDN